MALDFVKCLTFGDVQEGKEEDNEVPQICQRSSGLQRTQREKLYFLFIRIPVLRFFVGLGFEWFD